MMLTRALCTYFQSGYHFVANTTNSLNNLTRSLPQALTGGKTRHLAVARIILLGFVVATLAAASVDAASINYGDFNIPVPGVMFLDVTESSGSDSIPMYGPPDPFAIGLDFDPKNFTSTTSNGGADITDGQLNFTAMGLVSPDGLVGIDAISVFEAGDYTLAGFGTPATSAFAGAIMRATVTQINGLPIVGGPVNLIPVNASVGFSLPGVAVTQPWSLGLFLDIGAQLASFGYGPDDVATKVEVAINNSLVSTSQPSTTAFIAKKDFRIDLVPVIVDNPVIPEPSALLLATVALCGLGFTAGRNRG